MTKTDAAPTGAAAAELEIRFSEDTPVYPRVLAILAELPAIGKDAFNEQQKFHYRSHDEVLNALNPLLARYGVFMVPNVVERKTAQRTTGQNKVMYEVNLLVEYTFYGPSGDTFVASAWGEGTDMGDKATNKAFTMAFKNVIAQVFAVSTSDTIDADSQTPEDTVRKSPEATEEDYQAGRALLAGAPSNLGQIHEALVALDSTVDWQQTLVPLIEAVFGVSTRQEIPAERTQEFWRRLANAVAEMGDPSAFPSPGDEAITEALAVYFDGVITEVVVNEAVADAEAALSEEQQAAMDASDGDDVQFGAETPGAYSEPNA